ncbi:MAG: RlmE family RNA methyltransferase [Alphaproteobacteria bacterium]|nr:RlmE family RNA methyltransferase [Alphaproteobacteria bacterium]
MGRKGRRSNPYAKPDRFSVQAKDEGYKARSVYKLTEAQKRFSFLKPGQRVVDLGCFPGSWSQYALERIGRGGRLVGVDLEAPELPGTWIARSVLQVTSEELLEALEGPADVVLSDMAPATTGVAFTDHVRQVELVRRALALAAAVGAQGSVFFCKVFDGEEVPALQAEVRAVYGTVKRLRPEAVRQQSREFFLLGLDKREGPSTPIAPVG